MLHLSAESDRAWLERALSDLDALLLDHAHCEQKAAGTAVTLLFRYPDRPALQAPLSALAREELGHFEQVLRRIESRGGRFRPQRASPYAGLLHREIRPCEPERLLDTLLVCALIEARSCERFGLLAEAVPDPDLAGFYRSLLAAEARHHGLFVELATGVADASAVAARLAGLSLREAELLERVPPSVRLHAGGGDAGSALRA